MSKYNSKKIAADGKVFESLREFNRYRELTLLQYVGKIYDLRCQVEYELIPPKSGRHRKERGVCYIADFVYKERTEQGDIEVVEDAKGCRTRDYIIKRKLMLAVHGISIREV